MSICPVEQSIDSHHENQTAADSDHKDWQDKINDEYTQIDMDMFEDAIRNAEPQDYINLYDAFKANDSTAIMDAVKKLQRDYVIFLNPSDKDGN